ncbi:MAG: putative zinc-binding protein [Phycisphaerales bacterium]|nr:MAG: putative zinc-binding protein [Phycisphaerales bacterium]UCF15805.1 MAG: putative zinc-binding protein [Phycisphaerales bacterium]
MCGESECCSAGPRLIFACSGAADVGEVADRAARGLTRNGFGKMFCLAGVGGRVDGIMKKTAEASDILAIDGCDLDCTKNCLEQAGFTQYRHIRVTDQGMEKGRTDVSEENIVKVLAKSRETLAS